MRSDFWWIFLHWFRPSTFSTLISRWKLNFTENMTSFLNSALKVTLRQQFRQFASTSNFWQILHHKNQQNFALPRFPQFQRNTVGLWWGQIPNNWLLFGEKTTKIGRVVAEKQAFTYYTCHKKTIVCWIIYSGMHSASKITFSQFTPLLTYNKLTYNGS